MKPVVIRRSRGEDWQLSREIRLQALRDAPLAFASTYEREAAFEDAMWLHRIASSAQFLAIDQDEVVGTATGFVDPEDTTTALLVAMYVAPAARGNGIGERLVDAVVASARADGAHRVRLHVVETNPVAERLYSRCGFVRTGATMRLPPRPDLLEYEMELVLSRIP